VRPLDLILIIIIIVIIIIIITSTIINDVMHDHDRHFVPNWTIGAPVVKAMRKHTLATLGMQDE
jgi:uncharacterized protein YxeA